MIKIIQKIETGPYFSSREFIRNSTKKYIFCILYSNIEGKNIRREKQTLFLQRIGPLFSPPKVPHTEPQDEKKEQQ